MEIKFIELEIKWPQGIKASKLRPHILSRLKDYGDPLRWAITSLNLSQSSKGLRYISIEAVVLIYPAIIHLES